MIQVVSISFQLAGALILLLWSFKAMARERVIERCFVKGAYIERDDCGNGHIDKKRLQNVSKETVLNVFAFINLIIGYGITFWESNNFSRPCAILITILMTTGLLLLEYLLAWFISWLRFPKDIILSSKEIEKMDVITESTAAEIEEMFYEVMGNKEDKDDQL